MVKELLDAVQSPGGAADSIVVVAATGRGAPDEVLGDEASHEDSGTGRRTGLEATLATLEIWAILDELPLPEPSRLC